MSYSLFYFANLEPNQAVGLRRGKRKKQFYRRKMRWKQDSLGQPTALAGPEKIPMVIAVLRPVSHCVLMCHGELELDHMRAISRSVVIVLVSTLYLGPNIVFGETPRNA